MTGGRRKPSLAPALLAGSLLLAALPVLAEDAIEEVVEVEVVEVIQAVESADGAPAAPLGAARVAGRLHPALVHLPIGFLFLAALLQIAALTRRGAKLDAAVTFALAATLAACIPALASGFMRACEMWPAGPPAGTATWHRDLMLVMSGLVAAALALRFAFRGRLAGWRLAACLAVLLAAVVAAAAGGHLGGKLVFGEDFLPW